VTVGIVGTGLIGGSIGLRARQDGVRVLGYDVDPRASAEAVERGAIERAVERDELYGLADTVVIAAHLNATLDEIARLRETPPRAELVIDIASVKACVVGAARGLAQFVATHPMAGTERRGARHASADLFAGKTWAYVPSGNAALDARARRLIESFGGIPLSIGAEEHDRIVAFTSHLPQVVASVYARQARRNTSFDALCGSLARELLRVGDSGFLMWHDILAANAANVERELRALGVTLLDAADALQSERIERLRERFAD
jgi:prephenate dehydrogenase